MNGHAWVTSEHGRKIDCLAMIGTIDQVDLSQNPPLATVNVDDLTTDWLPMGFGRAGPNSDWDPYENGEQVLVISPYGDPAQGVIVCAINQNAFPPPSQSPDQWWKRFKDGTFIMYDRAAHAMTVDASQSNGSVTVICKTSTVQASDSIVFDTPKSKFTGDVEIDGNTTLKGDAEVDGTTSLKDVTSNGINISNTHKHGNGNAGQPTTAVIG